MNMKCSKNRDSLSPDGGNFSSNVSVSNWLVYLNSSEFVTVTKVKGWKKSFTNKHVLTSA